MGRRVVTRTFRVVLGLGLGLAIVAFLLVGVGPLTGRYRVITVLSGSMRPTMPPGSLVISTPEPISALRVGQVVTFEAPTPQHQVVTHRVIKIIASGGVTKIRTKGDANAAPDVWTAQIQGNTVWQERAAIPQGGRLVYWFRQPAVHRLTVDVIPFALIGLVLWTIWGAHPTGRRPALA
ncbi:MAG: signal peptidase I [Acidimicrobiales bacterium]